MSDLRVSVVRAPGAADYAACHWLRQCNVEHGLQHISLAEPVAHQTRPPVPPAEEYTRKLISATPNDDLEHIKALVKQREELRAEK